MGARGGRIVRLSLRASVRRAQASHKPPTYMTTLNTVRLDDGWDAEWAMLLWIAGAAPDYRRDPLAQWYFLPNGKRVQADLRHVPPYDEEEVRWV